MKAIKLYDQLEKDFISSKMSDDWANHMGEIKDYLSDNFKERSMGLVCDFTKIVEKVYTAVFPSDYVMKKILNDGAENALLFVHHPSIWDIRKAPDVFSQMNRKLLQKFKEKNISIYNLHVPLDNFGIYSTSLTLVKALYIEPKEPFAPYFGSLAGLFGKTELKTIEELKNKFKEVLGHNVILYKYGKNIINNSVVAVVAGGGNSVDILEEIASKNVNTFITGITAKNNHSNDAHEFARKHKINLLGGTHYSTEKFACIAMCGYFNKFGLLSEFIEDKPIMEDM
jgi:putative NIF3 family GTP cyclohydrolase 1 type 2